MMISTRQGLFLSGRCRICGRRITESLSDEGGTASFLLGENGPSRRAARRSAPSAPESAHQQRGGSPRRTEHWLSVVEGNCAVERRGGKQPEANNQSIIKKMMNSIRPDALASLLGKGEAQNGKLPGKGERQQSDTEPRRDSERGKRNAWGGWR